MHSGLLNKKAAWFLDKTLLTGVYNYFSPWLNMLWKKVGIFLTCEEHS